MTDRYAEITGWGSALPPAVLTNADVSRIVDTSDEWITTRTGIKERRISHVDVSELGRVAGLRAIAAAGLEPGQIDMVINATCTPDNLLPASAGLIQDKIGAGRAGAMDLNANCSGFVYAHVVGDSMIKSGAAERVLVIGAEKFSYILDWTDRTTCVLFGDGAGAVVVRAGKGSGTNADRGILGCHIHSDGRYCDKLYVDGGPSTTKTVGHLRMEGREVFKHAVVNIAAVMDEAITKAGLKPQDIDWFVPHQANRRILEGTAKKLGVPEDRIVMTLDRHGNTSAASIPLAFDAAVKDGRIKRGQLVLMEAMGGGFTWGAVLARF